MSFDYELDFKKVDFREQPELYRIIQSRRTISPPHGLQSRA